MSYFAGIDLGTTFTAAAVERDGRVEMVTLGSQAISIPSVVFVDATGGHTTGDVARRRLLTEPDRVAVGFKRRLGDPAPVVLGGAPYPAHLLTGHLLSWVLEQIRQREGGDPATVTITHPANWGLFRREYLSQAIRAAQVADALMLTEPEAAAIAYAASERVPVGNLVAVYDLGGGTFDAALLRRTEGGFELVGRPDGVERLGGLDFDEALFRYVLDQVELDLGALDSANPDVMSAVQSLQDECVEAKIALSTDIEAVVPVNLPDRRTRVTVSRSDFEDRIRPLLTETIVALRRTLASASVRPEQLDRVLLVGGSSRIPLVSQLVAQELDRPVALDADPKNAVAKGAAIHAALQARGPAAMFPIVADPAATQVVPPVPPPPPSMPSAPPAPAPVTVASAAVLTTDGESPPSSRRPWFIAGGAVLVVALIAVLVVVMGSGDDGSSTTVAEVGTTDPPTTDSPVGGVATTAGGPAQRAGSTTTLPPAQPGPVGVTQVDATATAPPAFDASGATTTFDAVNVVDGDNTTAWRTPGDAVGERIIVTLDRRYEATSVGLLPGYDKIDPVDGTDRWLQNRRPTSVRWTFDDGTSVVQTLTDTRTMQTFTVSASTASVVLEILGSTPEGERDFTAISEVEVLGS